MSARITRADPAPPYVPQETVYVVLGDELQLVAETDGIDEARYAGDSAYLPKGSVRSVTNRTDEPARLLVVIANSEADS
jgi:quercetin dioxygenase-like cupin family protein